jgi:glycosyltransferase involved in cell wall biosynthesis
MNICLVNADFAPARGSGQTVYAEAVAKGLASRHQVTVVTSRPPGTVAEEDIAHVRVVRIATPEFDPSRWVAFGYLAARQADDLMRREQFDALHFLDAHVGYACRGRFSASLHQSFRQRLQGDGRLPYHSSLRNLVQRLPYYRFAKVLERRAVKRATRLISISGATRDEFANNYGVDPSQIEVIHNGIDTELFKPTESRRLKEKLGLGHEKILLYVGFSTARKGLEHLAQALRELRHRDVRLVIVGTWERGYRERFYRYLGDARHRVLEVGYVGDEEMAQYYSLADVFVLPSLLEGFGYPVVEALACGTPVIGTSAGSIPEVVGDCGIIVPPRDAGALAEAIDRMLSDGELREGIRSRSRNWVCENFSRDMMITRTEAFFLDLAARAVS